MVKVKKKVKKKVEEKPAARVAVRTPGGQWAKGHCGGGGNPNYNKIALYRGAINAAVTVEDIKAVMRKMVRVALSGDVAAAKVVLDRCLGAVKQEVTIEEAGRRLVAEEIVDAGTIRGRVTSYKDSLVEQLYTDKGK